MIKNASDLKFQVSKTGSNFFERSTMKFFGDTMANYTVSSKTVDYKGVQCYELRRRKPVKHGLQSSAFFNAKTFERVL
jgi:hypothetical protein